MTKDRPLAYPALPAGYDLYETLDMAKDRQVFLRINICAIAAVVTMVFCGTMRVPLSKAFSMDIGRVLMCVSAMCIGLVVYVFLHEWVHGVFIRMFTGEKAEFGFVPQAGMAYAKSSWLFGKFAYIVIALAPVVIWGAVLAVLIKDMPEEYFWYIYALQMFNVSGAAGDLYVTWLISRMPEGVVVLDSGTSMKFFAPVNLSRENDKN